ncbi:transcriptional regulator [Veronia nyctiphanis]|uniref:Transcriptional regulator n=1 Tax=Veronia nyctiphanis TaxID=1278244 RepID=A0A4Q0YZR4_9GAMM|nr:HlyU family transcriptional regulator [Veronia nyctiphanis]RXJ74669.1 transcriptional regulator [Veronia nyctiphanis]
MSFFSWLFGEKEQKTEVEPTEYKGFLIYSEPKSEGGQYRINGRICKETDGELKIHHFIRSDILPAENTATELMINKAKMYIDQMGESMFN